MTLFDNCLMHNFAFRGRPKNTFAQNREKLTSFLLVRKMSTPAQPLPSSLVRTNTS